MKDINGVDIQEGQTIKLIKDEGQKFAGFEYAVKLLDFENGGPGSDLCAVGHGTIALLFPERAAHYQSV